MKRIIIISIACFVLGGISGWAITLVDSASNTAVEVRSGGYQFINPLLECEIDGGIESKNLESFKNVVQKAIDQNIADGNAQAVSVYYRDLNNGPWFGISENSNFAPQSLLKVPLMIAYLKEAEEDRGILNETIMYSPEYASELEPNLDEDDRMESGKAYTVEELISRMITLSDNDAFYLLTNALDKALLQSVLIDLGITVPKQDTPDNFISVKAYASLFRVLYNASYLGREMSEYALELMTHTSFEKALQNGVPEGVYVAHKFGVRELFDEQAENQLHDCGIVYDEKPYLLCVMTKGRNTVTLAQTISLVSSVVFEEASK